MSSQSKNIKLPISINKEIFGPKIKEVKFVEKTTSCWDCGTTPATKNWFMCNN